MNYRIVIGSGIVTSLVGVMLGLVASAMVKHSRVSERTPNTRRNLVAGATVGFIIGAGSAALKQEGEQFFEEVEESEEKG